MTLTFAFLASAAEIGADGRFFVLGGGIDGILVATLPSQIPAIAVVASMHFPPDECGVQHRVRMTATRPDGTHFESGDWLDVTPTALTSAPHLGANVRAAFGMYGFPLPEQGRYTLNFSIGDRHIGTLEFSVELTSQSAADGDQS